MTKYKIFGDLVDKYYLEVEAESLADAYEIADAADKVEKYQAALVTLKTILEESTV